MDSRGSRRFRTSLNEISGALVKGSACLILFAQSKHHT